MTDFPMDLWGKMTCHKGHDYMVNVRIGVYKNRIGQNRLHVVYTRPELCSQCARENPARIALFEPDFSDQPDAAPTT